MKHVQFIILYCFFVLFVFSVSNLKGQTYSFLDSGVPAIYTQTTPKSGDVTYDEVGVYNIGKDTTNTDYKYQINRSRYQFDISRLPSNAKILSVKCNYQVNTHSSGHKKFSVTDNQPTSFETLKQTWKNIPNSTIKNGLSKSIGSFSNAVLTARIKKARTSNGVFYLGAVSENETAKESYANIVLEIEIKYEILKLTVENKMGVYNDGVIGVGINYQPVTQKSSPFITPYPYFNYGDLIKLNAIENQDLHGYIWIWNDYEAPDNKSVWVKAGGAASNPIPNNGSQTTSYSVVQNDGGAKLIANLRKICNVTEKYEFSEAGISGIINTTTRIEGNKITFSAPPTRKANGLTGNFFEWTGSSENIFTTIVTQHRDYTAKYKVTGYSNNSNAFTANNQRKIVRTGNGELHKVYESLGRIWYERSTNNGSTWTIMNNGKPLSTYNAKLPSIDFKNNIIAIVYQEDYNSYYSKIQLKLFEYGSEIFSKSIYSGYSIKYSSDAFPVIATTTGNQVIIVWKPSDGYDRRLQYWIGEGIRSISKIKNGGIPYTDANSTKPSIVSNSSLFVYDYHLAWQQNSSSGSNIEYIRLSFGLNRYGPYFNDYSTPSLASGEDENFNPSIAITNNYPRVVWLTDARRRVEGNLITKGSGTSWGTITKFSNGSRTDIESIVVNSLNTKSGYVVAYGGDGRRIKYYKDNGTNTYLYNYDKFVQLSNGANYTDMVLETFNTASLPFAFSSSLIDATLSKTNSENDLVKGKRITFTKGNSRLLFEVNDITVDNNKIDFIKVEDDFVIKSKKEAVNLFETSDFQLNDNSNFSFNVNYSITDKAKLVKHFNFELQLVDAKTNKVIGVLEKIESSDLIPNEFSSIRLGVDTEGIGSKRVKLKLVVDGNMLDKISMADTYSVTEQLTNESTELVAFNNKLEITDYALSQNYPNPFNPSTLISYQIPNDGMVSLKIYDITGQEVTTLVNQVQSKGRYEINFDASSLSSGVYFYRINSGSFTKSMKMLLLK